MFIAKKILSAFLIPPGLLSAFLIFLGLWYLIKGNYKSCIANCLIGTFIWLISISPVSDPMIAGLESPFKIPQNPKGDVIILLGGGVYDNVPDISGRGTPMPEMLGRLVAAVRIQKRLNVPVIVSAGKVYPHKGAEAPIDKRFLVDLGVPAVKIIMEEKSRDTIENARYTKKICSSHGFKKPILVTSAYHMKRAVLSFEKVGMKVTAFPVNFKSGELGKYEWDDYLPDISAFVNSAYALHEYWGLLFYRDAY